MDGTALEDLLILLIRALSSAEMGISQLLSSVKMETQQVWMDALAHVWKKQGGHLFRQLFQEE